MKIKYFSILIIYIIISYNNIYSQDYYTVKGKVIDNKGKPIDLVNVKVLNTKIGGATNSKGIYELKIKNTANFKLKFSKIGYEKSTKNIVFNSKKEKIVNVQLINKDTELEKIDVLAKMKLKNNITYINPKIIETLPTTSGNSIESFIKILPGVSSNNELSSSFNVRGGNFDENLIYVNDIEIYRPLLIRSGQQEGLSFINSDLVSSIAFSSGGYEAKYGDKMSSVLDIKYKKPREFAASAAMSLLGGSVHVEGASPNKKFSIISGFRYKSSTYLLNSLETSGEYKPLYNDIQIYTTYDINNKIGISFLGHYSYNKYLFVPNDRSTTFGTKDDAVNLYIDFEGKEIDKYSTYFGALTINYQANDKLNFKLISSGFKTQEEETFDIKGRYSLNLLDNSLGSSTMGDSIMNLGIGMYLHHARNFLDVNVYSLQLKGLYESISNVFQWGIKYQNIMIDDNINEWKMLDSAGYSIPSSENGFELSESVNQANILSTNKINSFVQQTYNFPNSNLDMSLTSGLRVSYWDFNKEILYSPRFSFSYMPDWEKQVAFHLALGVYYQSPFYKEYRNIDGKLNYDTKSQKSIHYVIGSKHEVLLWNRKFNLSTELYYKKFDDLIPYEVDNIRIRYLTDKKSSGYARGIDIKINGEFVKGAESWLSFSLMQTREDIVGDNRGEIPRPTDQLANIGLFFQDYVPGNENFKMHLTLIYGSRLPYGPPKNDFFRNVLRMPAYKRVDIGFSVLLKKDNSKNRVFKHFKKIWLGVEVFNLLGIDNTVSYTWITTVPSPYSLSGTYAQFAVPNRLTARRFNIRFSLDFGS